MSHARIQALVTAVILCAGCPAIAEEKTMPVDGAELFYVEAGDGTPVLFVHGAISDRRAWAGYADRIAASRRFIAYTQRYFGPRDWLDAGENFSRETHVDDLIAFVEALDVGPVDLVTWSYGGEIGTYAALRRPDLFRAIVHYEPAVDALLEGLPGADAARTQFISRLGPAIAALEAEANEDAALRFIEAVFQMPEGAADTEPGPFPSYWRDNGRTLPSFVSMAPGLPLSCDDLAKLNVPTLVVVGAETLVRYAMMAEQVARCSGNALLLRMEGVNHDGPYRKPDEFMDAIEAFLRLADPA